VVADLSPDAIDTVTGGEAILLRSDGLARP
jgi:hypothetical protein